MELWKHSSYNPRWSSDTKIYQAVMKSLKLSVGPEEYYSFSPSRKVFMYLDYTTH